MNIIPQINSRCRKIIRGQLIKIHAKHIENDCPHFSKIVPGRLNGFSDFQTHLLCEGIVRCAVNVMLMGFPYIVENGVPCFVRHMAEEIFFLYFCGKKCLRIEISVRLLVFLNNNLPLFFQRFIKSTEGRG